MYEHYEWTEEGSVTIPASKIKMLLVFIGALLFVVIGFWMFTLNGEPNASIFTSLIAILCIFFFGAVAISSFTKLFTSLKYGLRISSEGIDDRSSGVSIGLVPWPQILDFKVTSVNSTKFILIYISDPQAFISQQSFAKQIALKANYKSFGTPITISAVGLACGFSTLLESIEKGFDLYK